MRFVSRPATTPVKPTLVDPETDYKIPQRVFSGWIPDNGQREIVRPLTADERSKLERRAVELRDGLRPHICNDEAAVKATISAMLSGFRAMRQDGEDVAATVEITRNVLQEFPLWAIVKGCMMIARREAGLDPRFAPNDVQLFDVIEQVVRPYRAVLKTIEALLTAPVRKLPPPPAAPTPGPGHDATGFKFTRTDRGDGKHSARVAADLEARRLRREALASQAG
jgi:hypothetical protein